MGAAVPGTPEMAVVPWVALAERHGGGRQAAGVDHVDADRRHVAAWGRDQAALERERRDAGEQVAAVLPVGDDGIVHNHLEEVVVDVGRVRTGAPDHRDLARQRVGATHAVDLPLVGRSHDPEQEIVAARRVPRQVVGQEIEALGRPAAHDHAPDPVVHGVSVHDVHIIVDNVAHARFPGGMVPLRAIVVTIACTTKGGQHEQGTLEDHRRCRRACACGRCLWRRRR
jgi:hypothetical protein